MHQYDSYPSSIETKTDKVQSVDISDNMNAYLTTQNSVSVITKNRVQSLFDEKNMEDELNGNVQYIESRKSIYALIDEGHVSFTKNDLM
jgi:hypothetical protein